MLGAARSVGKNIAKAEGFQVGAEVICEGLQWGGSGRLQVGEENGIIEISCWSTWAADSGRRSGGGRQVFT